MKDIVYLSATEMVRKIQVQEVPVESVVRTSPEQIERHNARINAITDLRPATAIIQEAREKDLLLKQPFT